MKTGRRAKRTKRAKEAKEAKEHKKNRRVRRKAAKTREESDRGNNSTGNKVQERCDCINKMRRLIAENSWGRGPSIEMQMAAKTGLRLAAVVGPCPKTKIIKISPGTAFASTTSQLLAPLNDVGLASLGCRQLLRLWGSGLLFPFGAAWSSSFYSLKKMGGERASEAYRNEKGTH